MAKRHDVTLTYKSNPEGRSLRELRLDGEKVKGVRRVTVELAYNDPCPVVTVELLAGSLNVGADGADVESAEDVMHGFRP